MKKDNVVDIGTQHNGTVMFRKLINMFGEQYEEALQRIRDNPEQFIEDSRPYVEGLRELMEELKNDPHRISMRPFNRNAMPSNMPRSTVQVTIQDYERWKRMDACLDRIKTRLDM